jgi:hypothetical protein
VCVIRHCATRDAADDDADVDDAARGRGVGQGARANVAMTRASVAMMRGRSRRCARRVREKMMMMIDVIFECARGCRRH